MGPLGTSSAAELLLHSKRDFAVAGDRAKQIVRGHDEVIDGTLARMHDNLTLGKRRRDGGMKGPLASFLLVGPDGVGKRYLTRVIAKLVYHDGIVDVFQCDRITPDQLIGMKDAPGEVLELVRKQPCRIILFEHVDLASADVSDLLAGLLTTGKLRSRGSDKDVSFEYTTIVFTTTKATDMLSALVEQELGEAAWQQRAVEAVAEEAEIDGRLLTALTGLFYCGAPDALVKSEVIALLLQKECGAHRTKLAYVDPEIIATQVLQIDAAHGFAEAPQLVKTLLRKPLVAAAADDHKSLSLRVRTKNQTRWRE